MEFLQSLSVEELKYAKWVRKYYDGIFWQEEHKERKRAIRECLNLIDEYERARILKKV